MRLFFQCVRVKLSRGWRNKKSILIQLYHILEVQFSGSLSTPTSDAEPFSWLLVILLCLPLQQLPTSTHLQDWILTLPKTYHVTVCGMFKSLIPKPGSGKDTFPHKVEGVSRRPGSYRQTHRWCYRYSCVLYLRGSCEEVNSNKKLPCKLACYGGEREWSFGEV